MNKKETLEIRKQFTNENCAITRICGCYVDAEKQIRTEFQKNSVWNGGQKSSEYGISHCSGNA